MKRKRKNDNLLELFFSQVAVAKNLGHARAYNAANDTQDFKTTETLLWKPV